MAVVSVDGRPADGVWDGGEWQEPQSHHQYRSKIHLYQVHASTPNINYRLFLYLMQNNGSVNVHIDLDQPVQSEPRLRLVLAENLLRDINNVIQRMEVKPR